MAETSTKEAAAFVEKLTEGPLDRPAVLKEICMDLLMLQVQSAGILQYLVAVAPLSEESKKEVERLHERMGERVDSMLEALMRLEGKRG
jgi:hypothetical protein